MTGISLIVEVTDVDTREDNLRVASFEGIVDEYIVGGRVECMGSAPCPAVGQKLTMSLALVPLEPVGGPAPVTGDPVPLDASDSTGDAPVATDGDADDDADDDTPAKAVAADPAADAPDASQPSSDVQ